MTAGRRLALTLAAAAGAACTRPHPILVAPETPFALAPGESARTAEGVGVQYVSLIDDSRCPPGVQCVWAGTVRIAVTLTAPSRDAWSDTLDLVRKRRGATVDGFAVRFMAFEPPPVPPGAPRIDPARSRASFAIERPAP